MRIITPFQELLMHTNGIRNVKMTDVPRFAAASCHNWLWHGYLLPGEVTILTSQ
ncbi:MAG: hypothetical protein K8T89_14920 [Planctomycetes bacterium]|nr:hypothetical protein [Planctomycetota bacterium]